MVANSSTITITTFNAFSRLKHQAERDTVHSNNEFSGNTEEKKQKLKSKTKDEEWKSTFKFIGRGGGVVQRTWLWKKSKGFKTRWGEKKGRGGHDLTVRDERQGDEEEEREEVRRTSKTDGGMGPWKKIVILFAANRSQLHTQIHSC